MNIRQIYGCINAGSSIHSGNRPEFTVEHVAGGLYMIRFQKSFSTTPAVVATQNWREWNDFTFKDGNTKDNVTVVAVNRDKVLLKTGDANGNGVDRNFCFMAMGQ